MTEGRHLRAAVAAGCAYEVFALVSGRAPTISRLCRRHRVFEVVLLGVLVIHLHHREALRAPEPPGGDRQC